MDSVELGTIATTIPAVEWRVVDAAEYSMNFRQQITSATTMRGYLCSQIALYSSVCLHSVLFELIE